MKLNCKFFITFSKNTGYTLLYAALFYLLAFIVLLFRKDSKKIETNMDESHDIIKIEDNEREPLLMEI